MKIAKMKSAALGTAALGIVALCTMGASAALADGALTIRPLGLRNDKGVVRCAVYASDDGFPSEPKKARITTTSKITGTEAICSFSGLAPGEYAVSFYHDEDGNNELDTNFLGIPSEGYGASNDARGTMSAPKFKDAKFKYGGGALELKLKTAY